MIALPRAAFDLPRGHRTVVGRTYLCTNGGRADAVTVADQFQLQPIVADQIVAIDPRSGSQVQVAIVIKIGLGILVTVVQIHKGAGSRGNVAELPASVIAV